MSILVTEQKPPGVTRAVAVAWIIELSGCGFSPAPVGEHPTCREHQTGKPGADDRAGNGVEHVEFDQIGCDVGRFSGQIDPNFVGTGQPTPFVAHLNSAGLLSTPQSAVNSIAMTFLRIVIAL
jgi:hypothetical protein